MLGRCFLALSQTQNANRKLHEGNFTKPKTGNRQLTEASFAKLMLEDEGDAFQFYRRHKMLIASHTKATSQNQKLGTVSSPKPASLN
jgi:hypothetical protein